LVSQVRVWAEEREGNELLLTWSWPEETSASRDSASDARTVAATVGILDGVLSATPSGEGVVVVFDPTQVDKAALAAALRSALAQEDDLKTRSNEMMKRLPKYASLAASLALDERLSPVPEVARQGAMRRTAAPARSAMPLRAIPGFPIVTQIYTFAPMMRSLRSWSRTAPPDAVEQHFTKAGLSREQLDRDLATAHEAIAFARSYAIDAAAKAAAKATTAAGQARDLTRTWIQKQQERKRSTE
jgi:hypothetical protein